MFLERWTLSKNPNMKSPHKTRSSANVKWSKLSDGWLKCNVDVRVFQACGIIGSGVALCDFHGYFVATLSNA